MLPVEILRPGVPGLGPYRDSVWMRDRWMAGAEAVCGVPHAQQDGSDRTTRWCIGVGVDGGIDQLLAHRVTSDVSTEQFSEQH